MERKKKLRWKADKQIVERYIDINSIIRIKLIGFD